MTPVRLAFVRRLHRYLDLGFSTGPEPANVRETNMAHRLGVPGAAARELAWAVSDDDERFPEIDGTSAAVRRLKEHMARVGSDADVTVIILGESGTGKERIARAIHRVSPRHRAAFVVVNCAGLAPTLIEDELFGHVRGAFTGAVDDQAGPFERANGGTVFLDEVGDLSPELQMKLLRALQQRTVQRLGGRQEMSFDVRIVAATNVDLARAKAEGRFREDLYYRLSVYELRVPPLRERGLVDLQDLASSILKRLAERRRRAAPSLAADVVERFARYDWPGNVRELESTLECMIVSAGSEPLLRVDHLPEQFGAVERRLPVRGAAPVRRRRPLPRRDDAVAAIERHDGQVGRAAEELGVSRHQLYRLLKRYGIRYGGGD
jgi:transcriptional regulator with PAS, ATPase and Fis domain